MRPLRNTPAHHRRPLKIPHFPRRVENGGQSPARDDDGAFSTISPHHRNFRNTLTYIGLLLNKRHNLLAPHSRLSDYNVLVDTTYKCADAYDGEGELLAHRAVVQIKVASIAI